MMEVTKENVNINGTDFIRVFVSVDTPLVQIRESRLFDTWAEDRIQPWVDSVYTEPEPHKLKKIERDNEVNIPVLTGKPFIVNPDEKPFVVTETRKDGLAYVAPKSKETAKPDYKRKGSK